MLTAVRMMSLYFFGDVDCVYCSIYIYMNMCKYD